MKRAVLQSRCECQAALRCDLSEDGRVLSGSARARGRSVSAPATRVGSSAGKTTSTHFDVGFLCPFCGRNTLRTFDVGALSFSEAS